MLQLDDVFSHDAASAIRASLTEEPCSVEEQIRAIAAVDRIKQLESSKRKELEALAERIARDAFPVFGNNELSVAIKAELVDGLPHNQGGKRIKTSPDLTHEYRKRKLANMITQGAGLGTHGVHHMDDQFRDANKELVELYDFIDSINMRSIRTLPDEMIENMSDRQIASTPPQGIVQLEYISGTWTINAKATIMPVLIHEIIKGMYELLSLYGLPNNYGISEQVMAYTDTIRNEFMDIKYGGAVYEKVRDFIRHNFHQFTDKRPEVLEYYIQELYEKPASDMLKEIDDIVSGKMDPKSIKSTIADIYGDIERDEREKNRQYP